MNYPEEKNVQQQNLQATPHRPLPNQLHLLGQINSVLSEVVGKAGEVVADDPNLSFCPTQLQLNLKLGDNLSKGYHTRPFPDFWTLHKKSVEGRGQLPTDLSRLFRQNLFRLLINLDAHVTEGRKGHPGGVIVSGFARTTLPTDASLLYAPGNPNKEASRIPGVQEPVSRNQASTQSSISASPGSAIGVD